jgi:3-hydroxyisobutyrate dehydrogenase-like beta-hydroxyacid dehydrogenase
MALKQGERWQGGPIGYIGLGNMGQPMVTHLLASGVPVTVCDVAADRVAAMAGKGASPAGSVAEVLQRCEVVVLSLPDPPAVETVVGELLAQPRRGATIVDLSTSAPALSQALDGKARAAGMQFVDAPVSGGPARSIDGTLTIMIGGGDAAVRAALPVLNVLGAHVVHVGGPGMGNVAKLVNNMAILCNQFIIAEALHLAEKAGIPGKTMVEIMSTGTARSYALDRTAPKMLSGDFKPGMTLTLALKDVALANQLGRQVGQPLRMAEQTEKMLRGALAAGLSEYDVSGMYEAVRRARGG